MDAAFNDSIFLWDTVFITMFCNLGHAYIPGIRSLDNFYCKQYDNGEIPREIVRNTGEVFDRWVNWMRKPLHSYFHNHYQYRGLFSADKPSYDDMFKPDLGRVVEEPPYLTLDNLNHPILAWAEMESYRQTGDVERLKQVWEPLYRYYLALQYHLRNQFGLFVTDWASMDNSPRNAYLGSGIDISCEMMLFAGQLTEISDILTARFEAEGQTERVLNLRMIQEVLSKDQKLISQAINDYMWDAESGFYYDVTETGERAPVKTIAAFWALLSGVANPEQAERLVGWLRDPQTFARTHRVPTLAADDEHYQPNGGYWQGAVWAPTNTMVIRGLERYGYHQLAREIAVEHLDRVVQVYQDTGKFWENYAADYISQGDKGKPDFIGWTGIGPILNLLEHAIGLRADAANSELIWNIDPSLGESGCHRYWFGGRTINLRATPQENGTYSVIAESDGPITLKIILNSQSVTKHLTSGEVYTVRL
ncbi:MGH1-like glycoside hydrolase domain-containing protein [Cohnella luojiensis]|uniref:MGH1-like glycoside hydrolase domain-containing protein n=1 Tax=Cohnella luojiensis TaxID=652876 RepID=UPI00143212DE|nr:trehalase family glycosidase [Cohnella luojiensis]